MRERSGTRLFVLCLWGQGRQEDRILGNLLTYKRVRNTASITRLHIQLCLDRRDMEIGVVHLSTYPTGQSNNPSSGFLGPASLYEVSRRRNSHPSARR